MVFVDLNTNESDMSLITSGGGGGSFIGLNSPCPPAVAPVSISVHPSTASTITITSTPAATTTTTNSTSSSIPPSSTTVVPVELSLPPYNASDPQSVLKTLIHCIVRTFYEMPKCLVIEYIYHHKNIKEQDLVDRLHMDTKTVRSFIREFKNDKFIIQDLKLEENTSNGGRRHQDQYYYKINETTLINVVKYRLIHMQAEIEKLERQQTYQQVIYKCLQCEKDYTELDMLNLFDPTQDSLVCPDSDCRGIVQEDPTAKEIATAKGRVANMILFNEQMKPLFDILKDIDSLMAAEQQPKSPSGSDVHQHNGNASTAGSISALGHRSHASNLFDRTSAMNHDIQIILEKDDDDSTMDIDETSNNNEPSSTTASRGSGKSGKKSAKPVQSTAAAASQPLPANAKSTTKKTAYEHKPMPHWFLRSTVFVDSDEEHRLAASSAAAAAAASRSASSSNQKGTKLTTIDDIKEMLLVYESRRKKAFVSSTIEDSPSPPTPVQSTNKILSTSNIHSSQFTSNTSSGRRSGGIDEDGEAARLFHHFHDDSIHHMDIDNND